MFFVSRALRHFRYYSPVLHLDCCVTSDISLRFYIWFFHLFIVELFYCRTFLLLYLISISLYMISVSLFCLSLLLMSVHQEQLVLQCNVIFKFASEGCGKRLCSRLLNSSCCHTAMICLDQNCHIL